MKSITKYYTTEPEIRYEGFMPFKIKTIEKLYRNWSKKHSDEKAKRKFTRQDAMKWGFIR
jgi:hypothetical protein